MGIGFFNAGYRSFWHLSFMMVFMIFVAINYVIICRLYSHGGGVYSSVYHPSKAFAVIGALLLSADYIVTASLSVLSWGIHCTTPNPKASPNCNALCKISSCHEGYYRLVAEICSTSGIDYQIISIPSYEMGYTIAEQAATFGVDRVIMGATKRNVLENMLRGVWCAL